MFSADTERDLFMAHFTVSVTHTISRIEKL